MARPKVARRPKQPVIEAVTVPASKSSETPQAKKLLAAVGQRPKPAKRKSKPKSKSTRKSKSKPKSKPKPRRRRR